MGWEAKSKCGIATIQAQVSMIYDVTLSSAELGVAEAELVS